MLVSVAALAIALGGLVLPGQASALSTPKVISEHMPEVVEWAYHNGTAGPAACAEICTRLWESEHADGTPELIEALADLDTNQTKLWGAFREGPFSFQTRLGTPLTLGKAPLRIGWHITPGSSTSKWVEVTGPSEPAASYGCGPGEWRAQIKEPGQEVGSTFHESTPTAIGYEWYLLGCFGTGEIVAQQVRATAAPGGSGCGQLAAPPELTDWSRQEWWWNECYEGGPLSKDYAAAYYQPLRFSAPVPWAGQHLEGESTYNVEASEGIDPGSEAVKSAVEHELERSSALRLWMAWVLEGKPGANPLLGSKAEQLGPGSEAAPFKKPCEEGEPVNCATGNQFEVQSDIAVSGRGPGLDVTRTYNSQLAAAQTSPGPFGYGWTGSYSAHLVVNSELGEATVYQDDGSTVGFAAQGSGWVARGKLVQAKLAQEGSGYLYTLPDQTKLRFNSAGELTSETDRNGNALTMTRGTGGRLESVSDPAGRKLGFSYNAEGRIESVKDPMGHVVKYAYEGGNLSAVTEPGETSPRWQFKYDASHELTSKTDGREHTATTEYDSFHRAIKQVDALSRTRKWAYAGTEAAPETTISEPNGSTTVEHFNSLGMPTTVTRAYGTTLAATSEYQYDSAGDLIKATDPNGHTTSYGYDAEGNRASETNALGQTRAWAFDSTHDVISTTTPNGETTTIERDGNGNATKVSRPAPESKTQLVKYKYGSHGELESVTDPLERTWKYEYDSYGDRSGEIDPEGDKRTWKYNEDSREISTVSPRGHVSGAVESKFTTTIERDAQGRAIKVTDPLKHVTKYAYDANGYLESEADPESNVTSYTYDADNEPTKVKEPNGTTTETEYDESGQVVAQIDGNKHTTKYVRNALGEVTEIVDPLGRKTRKEYDAAGDLTKLTDAAKRTTTYAYDPANRLSEVSYSDGKTPSVKYEYDADGDRTKMVDGTGTSKYTYDQLDRLTESKDGHGDVVGYEYDLANEQTKITYPNGKSVSRTFDKDGRLESVTDWLGHTSKFGYDADSDQTSTTFPSSTTDVDQYAYEDDDAMEAVTMKKGTEVLASVEYSRNKDSQVTKATTKGLPGEEKPAFSYDENSRLSKGAGVKYAYDAANNPTTLGSDTYAYNSADELESATYKKATVATYAYDELGQRTNTTPSSGAATTYGYDQAGNLTAVTRPKLGETAAIEDSYGYDGGDLRTSQTVSGATTYLAWDMAGEVPLILEDGVNAYLYGPSGLVLEQIAGEGAMYLHHDQQGSTRAVTGSTGTVQATMTYDAFGNRLGSTGSAVTPLGYDGQYTNADTGLIYLRARTYDPTTAQFLSVDPIVADTGAPYIYSGDDPVNGVDSTGLSGFFGTGIGPEVGPDIDWSEVGTALATRNAGFWDGLTGGITAEVRTALGWNGGLDTCSSEYEEARAVGGYTNDAASAVSVLYGGGELVSGIRRGLASAGSSATIDEGAIGHIFREASGHLAEDTPENRSLIERVVQPDNYVRTGRGGEDLYRETLPDGRQAWAKVFDGAINNGGVNEAPLP
jgi:RHS repeat-associated protein